MIQDQIAAIQARLQRAENIPEATKSELRELLSGLQAEVETLARTNQSQAELIAQSTHQSTEHALTGSPESGAVGELRRSVEGFETSHPQLTEVVGRIATTLSNMGI